MQSQFEQGKTDLGMAFTKLNKYLMNNTCAVLIIAVKKLINNVKFGDTQKVGLLWLEKLYDFPKNSMVNFVKTKYPSVILNTQGPVSVPINDVSYVLSQYQK